MIWLGVGLLGGIIAGLLWLVVVLDRALEAKERQLVRLLYPYQDGERP